MYIKQNFENNQVLTAEHLNYIEDGIYKNGIYANLKGKKISFLGDSITTFNGWNPSGYAVWYPRGTITDVEQTWWKQLINVSGMKLLVNAAWSGSTVSSQRNSGTSNGTSAAMGASTKRIQDLAKNGETPDIVVVMIGINDFTDNVEVGSWDGGDLPAEGTISTFSESYALMVSKILKTYPKAEVFLCTLPEATIFSRVDDIDVGVFPAKFQNKEGTYTTLQDYNHNIRHIAEAMGVNILDMHACGITFFNDSVYLGDGLHPNAEGAKLMAKKALAELSAKSRHIHLLENEDIISDDTNLTETLGTWYVDVAKYSQMTSAAKPEYASFAYSNSNVISACQSKPINALRFAVHTAGTMSYGKVGNGTYTALGTIALKDPSAALQIYKINEVTLSTGERLWVSATSDSGLFYYDPNQNSVTDGYFNIKVSSSLLEDNSAVSQNLSVDIGYLTESEWKKLQS